MAAKLADTETTGSGSGFVFVVGKMGWSGEIGNSTYKVDVKIGAHI